MLFGSWRQLLQCIGESNRYASYIMFSKRSLVGHLLSISKGLWTRFGNVSEFLMAGEVAGDDFTKIDSIFCNVFKVHYTLWIGTRSSGPRSRLRNTCSCLCYFLPFGRLAVVLSAGTFELQRICLSKYGDSGSSSSIITQKKVRYYDVYDIFSNRRFQNK